MAKVRKSYAVCVGSRSFTYGTSREFEKMMKEPSRLVRCPVESSSSNTFSRPNFHVKG